MLELIMILLALLGGLLLLLCGIVISPWCLGSLTIALHSRRWPQAPGRVTESETRPNQRANGLPGHRYRVLYEYQIGSRVYEGNTVSGGVFPYGSRSWALRRAGAYPAGSTVQVHFDPEDPEQSVLEPGLSLECLYPVAVLLLLHGTAWGLLIYSLWRLWSRI